MVSFQGWKPARRHQRLIEVTLDHVILDHLSFLELHELLDGRHERQRSSILAKSLECLENISYIWEVVRG